MPIVVTCENGHQLRVKDEHAGKKVRCPKCGQVVQVPTTVGPPHTSVTELPADTTGVRGGADSAAGKASDSTCPACGAEVTAGSVICIDCGFDLRTGRSVAGAGSTGAIARGAKGRRRHGTPARAAPVKRGAWKLPVLIGGGVAAVAIVVVVAMFLAGRGASPAEVAAARSAAQAFLDASENRDVEAVRALLTEKARRLVPSGQIDLSEQGEKLSGTMVQSVTIRGDTAEVKVTLGAQGRQQEAALKLRRESGQWRVFALVVPLVPGGSLLTIDLENPQATAEQFGKEFAKSIQKGFKESFEKAVLGPSETEVKVQTDAVAAIESIGVDDFEATWKVDVKVIAVKEFAPDATGEMTLGVAVTDLPAGVVDLLAENTQRLLLLEQIVDSQGGNLLDAAGPKQWQVVDQTPSSLRVDFRYSLKNLLRGVTAIAAVRGLVAAKVPTKVDSLRFDQVAEGAVKESDATKLTLRSMRKNQQTFKINGRTTKQDQYQFWVDVEGVSFRNVRFVAFDAQGKPLGISDSGGSDFSERGTCTFSVKGQRPSAIEAKVIAQTQEVERAFALSNIPLESFGSQPVQLERLSYGNRDAPVSIQVLGLTSERDEFFSKARKEEVRKGTVRVRVTNHSNKDIAELHGKLDYLDTAGNKLKDFPVSKQGTYDLHSGRVQSVVAKGRTAQLELIAPFMPAATKQATFVIERLRFSDASRWDRAFAAMSENAPCVMGRATLATSGSGALYVGYVGLGEEGTVFYSSLGTMVSRRRQSGRFVSTTFQPRNTVMTWDEGDTWRFSHVRVPPGTYLVYVRWGERHCDWRWVRVTGPEGVLDVDLAIDERDTGDLEVVFPEGVKTTQVHLVPLAEDGSLPIVDVEPVRARIDGQLGTYANPKDRKAAFDGLRAGRYRAVAGQAQVDLEVKAGETVSVTLPDGG